MNIFELALQDRIFVTIIGGVGSGKNHFYKDYFDNFRLFDIDEYVEKLSDGNWEESRKYVSAAMHSVESDLKEHFNTGESCVNTCSGAITSGILKKMQWAKDQGYKTVVIFIDVSAETAMSRNIDRVNAGERGLIPEYKVLRTNEAARNNYPVLERAADLHKRMYYE